VAFDYDLFFFIRSQPHNIIYGNALRGNGPTLFHLFIAIYDILLAVADKLLQIVRYSDMLFALIVEVKEFRIVLLSLDVIRSVSNDPRLIVALK
jgi:hypothetical protein